MRWTRKAIVAEIKRLHAEGAELNYATAEEDHLNLVRAAAWHFGTWRRAVEAAGIEYDSISKYQRWSRERIVARIRELHSEGADLNWRAVSTEIDPPLAAAALRPNGFQNWRDAIRASGLDINGVARYQAWDEERVIKDIKALHRARLPLSSKAVQLSNQPLFCAARRRFGSWDEALAAAGLSAPDIRLRQASGVPYGAVQQSNASRNGTSRERPGRNAPASAATASVGKSGAAKGATAKGSTAKSAASKGGSAQKTQLPQPSKRAAVAPKGAGKATPKIASRRPATSKTAVTPRTAVQISSRPGSGSKNVTKAAPSTQIARNTKNQSPAKSGAAKGGASKVASTKSTAVKGTASKATAAKGVALKAPASQAGATKQVVAKAGASKGTAVKGMAARSTATKGKTKSGAKGAAKRR